MVKINKTLEEAVDGKLDATTQTQLRQQLLLHELDRSREVLLQQIKAWEDEINRTTEGMPLIRVENDFDLVGPPPGFKYINDYIPRGGISIPDDPPVGCACTDCFGNPKGCYCVTHLNQSPAYTIHKK